MSVSSYQAGEVRRRGAATSESHNIATPTQSTPHHSSTKQSSTIISMRTKMRRHQPQLEKGGRRRALSGAILISLYSVLSFSSSAGVVTGQSTGTPSTATPTAIPQDRPTKQPTTGRPTKQPTKPPTTDRPTKPPTTDRPTKPPTTDRPTKQPTTDRPTKTPTTDRPTKQPTTDRPTKQPTTDRPTDAPREDTETPKPTIRPSTASPSIRPTSALFGKPAFNKLTASPISPTDTPTSISPATFRPTRRPTPRPTRKPQTEESKEKTDKPTPRPTTGRPSVPPTPYPTPTPTFAPTPKPSMQPSPLPSFRPSSPPTETPSFFPSPQPTFQPSTRPSQSPSFLPSSVPSAGPSSLPSSGPTSHPTPRPTPRPTAVPTNRPTPQPTPVPTRQPSAAPSGRPSISPSSVPSSAPSMRPTAQPSVEPSSSPSSLPSDQPSRIPSSEPSSYPSARPSALPSESPTVSFQPSISMVPSVVPTPVYEFDKIELTQVGVTMTTGLEFRRRMQEEGSLDCQTLWQTHMRDEIFAEIDRVVPKYEVLRVNLQNAQEQSDLEASTLLFVFDVLIEIRSPLSERDHDVVRYVIGAFDSSEEKEALVEFFRMSGCLEYAYVNSVTLTIPGVYAVEGNDASQSLLIAVGLGAAIAFATMLGVAIVWVRVRKRESVLANLEDEDEEDDAVVDLGLSGMGKPADGGYASEIGLQSETNVSALEDPVIPSSSGPFGVNYTRTESQRTHSEVFSDQGGMQSEIQSEVGDATVVSNIDSVAASNVESMAESNLLPDDATIGTSVIETTSVAAKAPDEDRFEVLAPAGMVGLILETNQDGVPVVNSIRPNSVVADQVQVGDRLMSVDGEDVTVMLASDASKLIGSKKNEPVRRFVFIRPANL